MLKVNKFLKDFKMKKLSFFVILLFFCVFSAYSQNNCVDSLLNFYGLDFKIINQWKNDTNGCKRIRVRYVHDLETNQLLVGMPKKLFILFFGDADSKVDEEFFNYNVNVKCDPLLRAVKDSELMSLVVLFKDDKVISISSRITER